ncbi:hypothetical protein GOB46_06665 [Sinorhizobium meliloti]|uniref:hypothetical protein n=1 Tax=Rhizobium meliloti TaxID=382 RepID=UPI000FD86E86|nr:hypothetical protein [Sinorhizobium meliloti]MDW9587624.1 hypothetical protein [Sinorhizobium meliloti]MDW9852283.1 hypothetical protein [Sinorhizobium meliloti]MDW9870494.1 hypothetical protein [Sinorhizobium meliloti]MDW9883137.1 hypothetical protein [Sinorhizobium meliloti]MDX0205340.1 hypothetical protein [Sinorhizobium meliloti]
MTFSLSALDRATGQFVDFEPTPATKLRGLWKAYEPIVDRFITQVFSPAELKPLINSALQV